MKRLSQIRQGDWVEVVDIPMSCKLRQPLQQFGIIPGSILICRYFSPGKELVAIECEGTVIALRLRELSQITVRNHL